MFVAGRIVKRCAGKQHQNSCMLMMFYNAGLPAMSMPTSNSVHPHDTSVALLRDNCPWILAKYVPCDVGIDGNRLFRSVSLALYGTYVTGSKGTHAGIGIRVTQAYTVTAVSSFFDCRRRRRRDTPSRHLLNYP